MPIILTEPIMIAGALVPVDGTTKTYNAAFEADQVAAGKAKWTPGSPAVGNQRVPLEVINSAQGIAVSSGDKTLGVNVRFLGKRPAFARCIASNFASPIAADAKCYGHAIAMPGKFDAVRIGFVHVGALAQSPG